MRELLDAGHEVIGLARTEAAEKKLITAAAKPHCSDAGVACYQFADRGSGDRGIASELLRRLVTDFGKAWSGVPRSRDTMTIVEEI